MAEKKYLDLAGLTQFKNKLIDTLAANSSSSWTVNYASNAGKLASAKTIALSGDVSGTATSFDGSQNITIATEIADVVASASGVGGSHGLMTAAQAEKLAGVAEGAQVNVIEEVQVNGVALVPSNKSVNVVIPAATVTDVQTKTSASGSYATVLNGTVAQIDLSGYALKSDITAVLDFKGTKASSDALPSTGNKTGDVWIVSTDNSEYVWTGTAWEKLGPVIDLSGFALNTTKVNGHALSGDITLDGSDIALTGYAKASASAAVAATDTVNAAVGKLEKKVDDAIADATTYAFATGSTNGTISVTPTVGGVAGSASDIAVKGLGTAAYTASTAYVPSNLTPAEAGAQVNVIETVKVNGSALTPDANKAVNVVIPAATVTDVQVKAHGANSYATALDGTTAKIDLSGLATLTDISLTQTANKDYVTSVSYDNATGAFTVTREGKGAVADNNTGLVDGNTVYDYIDAMAISSSEINALFPSA